MRAYIVFSGETDLRWLRVILRPGFRHCFVLLHDGRHWISLDPLACHFEVCVDPVSPDFDLPRWLTAQGCTVVPARLERRQRKAAPAMIFSCVEAVKRVLGLHRRFIITPWQLYCHLTHLNDLKGEPTWEV